ncbi:MAG: hypothetical protein KAR32_02810 [Candidatus Omnitrophica bacterium]|nr:hypothetical protein [Candidatus Omnitrophota bacterium]
MMIKKSLVLFFALVLFGCSYGQNYLKNPETFIRDPHFSEYKERRDDLERQYLHKEITYAQYIEQKDRLDETYDREVQERTDKIMSQE